MWHRLTRGVAVSGWRSELSVATIAVGVLVGVWSLYALAEVTQFPYDATFWGYAGIASPALIGLWLSIELLGPDRDEETPLLGRYAVRAFVVGPVLFTGAAVAGLLLLFVLVLTGGIIPDVIETGGPVAEVLLNAFLSWIIGLAAVLGGGLVGLVFVLLPVLSWRDPARAAALNAEEVPAGSLAQARVVRMSFSVMIMLVFLAPALWVSGERNAIARTPLEAVGNSWLAVVEFDPGWWDRYLWDILWVLGMLCALLLVLSVALVLWQRRGRAPSPNDS